MSHPRNQRPAGEPKTVARRGATHCRAGRYAEALADFNQTLELAPDYAWAMAHSGEVYRLLNRYREALLDFNQALDHRPDYAWALAHRGETYRQMKRPTEALLDFNQAIALNPADPWTVAHRGITYRRLWRYQAALADLNRALELKPDYAWALAYRGVLHGLLRRYKDALLDFEQAIALDETIAYHWGNERAIIFTYLGRYAEAIACHRQTLQVRPDDPMAVYFIAVAKVRWQGLAAAQAEVETARRVLLAEAKLAEAEASTPGAALYEPGVIRYGLGGLAALAGQTEQALVYLQEAIQQDQDPLEAAHYDPAWFDLRAEPRFLALISAFDNRSD